MSAWIAAAVPADANRYSTCADRVSRTTVGSTHASAVAVTEFAIPTTVSVCPPGSVMVLPVCSTLFSGPFSDHTIWADVTGQWPCFSTRSSTGPPADDRPTRLTGTDAVPSIPGTVTFTRTFSSGNGPATAVAPATRTAAE